MPIKIVTGKDITGKVYEPKPKKPAHPGFEIGGEKTTPPKKPRP